MRRVPPNGPGGRHGTLKSFLGAAVCAALVLVSPGAECYAAAGTVIRLPVAGAGTPAASAGASASAAAAPVALSLASPLMPSPALNGALAVAGLPAAAIPASPKEGSPIPLPPNAVPARAVLAAPVLAASPGPRSESREGAPAARDVLETGTRLLAEARDEDGRRSSLDDVFDNVRVFISRIDLPVGQAPASVKLTDLGGILASDPALKETVNKSGRIRVVLSKSVPNGGLTKADVAGVEKSLRENGVTAKLEVENISIDWKTRTPEPSPPAAETGPSRLDPPETRSPARRVIDVITAPFREAAYLGRTLKAAFSAPTLGMVAAGVVMKLVIPLAVLNQAGWISQYAGHPVALALALGFSLSINLFHGVWVGTWANFQNSLGKQRGLNYQAGFNFVYGQFLGVVSRIIAWSAIAGTVPPWSLRFWKDVGVSAVVGTFFGTLGFQGINALYNNGRFSQRQRDAVFLFRDLAMNLAGYFFGSGSMLVYWAMFASQQALDFAIYLASRKIKRRTILYVADAGVASSPEFGIMYPIGPRTEEESPLKQAWRNVINGPLVKPIIFAVKKLRDILRGKRN